MQMVLYVELAERLRSSKCHSICDWKRKGITLGRDTQLGSSFRSAPDDPEASAD